MCKEGKKKTKMERHIQKNNRNEREIFNTLPHDRKYNTTIQTSGTNNEQMEIGKFRQALPQFLAVSVKNILLFVYGMTLGYPTIVIPAIQGGEGREPSDIVLNRDQISWFSSINLICVPLGCIFSGSFTQPIGKIRAMQIVNIPIIISWLLFYFATGIEYLYAALFLSGLSGGLMEAPVLTYVSEITQPFYRGLLTATGSTAVISGVFIQFILGSMLDWRTIAAISTIFPVLSILALFFVPESPTWLLRKKRYNDAIKSLQWLRGWVPEYMVENEFNQLYDQLIVKPSQQEELYKNDNKLKKFIKEISLFKKRSFLSPFSLILFTFFVGHFSGKTVLQTYAVQIFHTLKAPINKYHATILLGLSELIATILCIALIHFTGKRPLVFFSTIGVGIGFFGTATYAYYLNIVPGFAISNVVSNASALVPKNSIITIDNITKIFEDEQKILLDTELKNLTDIINNGTDKIFSENFDHKNNSTIILKRKKRNLILNDNFNLTKNNTDNNEFESVTDENIYNDYDFTENNNNNNTIEDNFTEISTTLEPILLDNSEIYLKVQPILINDDTKNQILLPIPKQKNNKLAWLPLLLLLGAAFCAHLGLRLIPWMLIGEVFPASVRGNATGFAGGCGYILGFLANKFFLQMLATMTLPGTFWFYSSVAFFGTFVLYFILPETEGKTLAECEESFVKKKSELSKMDLLEIVEINKIIADNTLPLPIGLLEVPSNSKTNHKPKRFIKNTNLNNKNNGIENKSFKFDENYEDDDQAISRTTHF